MIVRSLAAPANIPDNVSLPELVFSRFDLHLDNVALIDGPTGRSYTYRQLRHYVIDGPTGRSYTNRQLRHYVIDGPTGRSYTYRQLRQYVVAVASALAKRGFKKGDILCIYSPNIPEFAIAYYGILFLGGTITTVNPLYTADELTRQLNDCKPRYLLTFSIFAENAREAAKRYGNIEEHFVFGEADGCTPFAELMKDNGSAFPTKFNFNPKEDVAGILYSSGTTGLPKGVMLTHYNYVANMIQAFATRDSDRVPTDVCALLVLPLFHTYGLFVLNVFLTGGSKIVLLPKFEAEQYLQCVEKYKVTNLYLVPPLVLFLAKHPLVSKFDLSSVVEGSSGAAALGADLQKEATSRMTGMTLFNGYGCTECCAAGLITPGDNPKPGSVGMLIANTEAKIIDVKTGEILGPNQDGELCLRGPNIMKGYFNNPKATANTVDEDGWLHTGDVAHFDDDQYFFIVDRIKELIKYKGLQVAPAELEDLLLSHPAVADVAVIGLPDEAAGELPRAYVVVKPGAKVTEKDIQDFVAGKVAHYKRLRGGVKFIDQIPKSASGKILRRELKDAAIKASAKL